MLSLLPSLLIQREGVRHIEQMSAGGLAGIWSQMQVPARADAQAAFGTR